MFCVAALGTYSYLEKPKRMMFLAASVVRLMVMVSFCWECQFHAKVRIREHPEFSSLMACDRRSWPRCLAWHGWLPALSPREIHLPWAVPMADGADAALECAWGAYPVHPGSLWDSCWDPEDVNDLAGDVLANPTSGRTAVEMKVSMPWLA